MLAAMTPSSFATGRLSRGAPALVLVLAACGGAPPPPPAAPKPVVVAKPAAPPVDLSEVPEPGMLVAIGRVKSPDAVFKVVNGWLRLPVLDSRALAKEALEADVGDTFDLTQPLDGAVTLGMTSGRPSPLAAFSVAVKSLDAAKTKLEGIGCKISPRENGQMLVELPVSKEPPPADDDDRGGASPKKRRRPRPPEEPRTCVLAPAASTTGASAARFVCGEPGALDALVPWLTRTAPRKTWPADVHVEMRPAAVRAPITALRSTIPALARSLAGNLSNAERDLLDATVGELADLATDIERTTMDAQIQNDGMNVVSRVEYATATSVLAQVAVAHPERAEGPPPAFWRLPADTELVAFGRGADPKLFERPRQLVAAWVGETLSSASMTDPDRQAVQELLDKRLFPLLVGPGLYAKGTSDAGLARARDAFGRAREGSDPVAKDKAELEMVSQALGWELLRVEEPVSKVGPVLRDVTQLWSRPSFMKWTKKKDGVETSMKIAPVPAAMKLPKDSVHLVFSAKRSDLETWPEPAKKTGKPKKVARAPLVVHVYAVPDAGATWLAFGLDEKLVSGRVAGVLQPAGEKETLAGVPSFQGFRDMKANSAVVTTLRTFTSFALVDGDASFASKVAGMPNRGMTPLPIVVRAEAPSAGAAAGAAVATFTLPRAAIEDLLRLFL